VEPVERNVDDPDAVEIDEEIGNGASLTVGSEEDSVPIDASEVCVAFGRRYIDRMRLHANKAAGKDRGESEDAHCYRAR
jgi:hypothetical protein